MRVRWRAGVLMGAVVLAATVAGCGTGVDTLSLPTPPTTPPPAPSPPTLPANLSSVNQAGVAGVTATTQPAIRPGQATLNGTVLGPNGAAPGATVEADRVVGNRVVSVQTTAAADGSWTISNILGGRYRVRAWQSPNLAMSAPQVVFLGGSQVLSMTLQLTAFKGPTLAMAITPSLPQISQPADMRIEVTNPTVGSDGVVQNPPETGARITLVNGPNWLVDNPNPETTDVNGDVVFEITCNTLGSDPLAATIGTGPPVSLAMPVCAAPPPPSTTTSTTFPCPTTSTSPPTGAGEVTTTTTLAFGECG